MGEREPVHSFGRYRILGWLGRGGMGSVYLAEQTGPGTFNRKVALKVLRVDENLSEERRLMLIDEAQLTALLNHPNVVTVYEAGEHDGKIFIALEWVGGVNLATLLKRTHQRLPLAVSAALLGQACDGLHAAHELRMGQRLLNLIHRDVSPSNLMVDPEGRVRVIDFGIARADIRMVTTAPQFIRGNPAYMAPEQLEGSVIDRRADIYSTALVFYELCTGTHPFQYGPTRGIVAPLRALCPDISPALGDLVSASLQLDPRTRPDKISLLGTAMWEFARAHGFTRPADLARYFTEVEISLSPAEPLRDASYAEFRANTRISPTTLVKRPTVKARPPSPAPPIGPVPLLHLLDSRVQKIQTPGRPTVWVYPTFIRATDRTVQEMAVSGVPNLLPAPMSVRCLGDALSVECRLPALTAARVSLYLDAQRPNTRLEHLLITAATPGQAFDVGHRKYAVRRVHYTVANPETEGLVASPGGLAPRVVAPSDCCMMVVFTAYDDDMRNFYMDCVCIKRSSQ